MVGWSVTQVDVGGNLVTVSYSRPLELAWPRVRRLLLEPFRLEVWLVLGFAAALAGLVERNARQGIQVSAGNWSDDVQIFRPPFGPWRFLDGEPWWILLWGPLMAVALLVGIALLWVSCRGKFVFLDDVLLERARIVEPWGRLGRLGDSLFLWWLAFHASFLVLLAAIALPAVFTAQALTESGAAGTAMAMGLIAVAVLTGAGLVLGYVAVAVLLDDFVVPLMYRDGSGVLAAWRRLAGLLRQQPASFLIYVVLVLLARVALVSIVALLALPTCCLLPLLLSLPYVGSVLLLPISATYRLYSVEFLGQFGEAWRLPAGPAGPTGPATPTPPGPPSPAAPAPAPPAAGAGPPPAEPAGP
jgi:hypothetical protein